MRYESFGRGVRRGGKQMLKIYGVYRSRATRTVWLAKELGIPFEFVSTIQANRVADPQAPDAPFNTKSPEFLRINPNAQVPALVDDGLALSESLAMNLYLARKHGGPVAPADLKEEALATMWSFWAATQAEPHAAQIIYNMVMKAPAERDAKLAAASVEALRGPFAILDAALVAGGGWLVGGRFTVADVNVAEVLRYALPAKELFEAAPNVKAWLEKLHARPAYKDVMAAREAEIAAG